MDEEDKRVAVQKALATCVALVLIGITLLNLKLTYREPEADIEVPIATHKPSATAVPVGASNVDVVIEPLAQFVDESSIIHNINVRDDEEVIAEEDLEWVQKALSEFFQRDASVIACDKVGKTYVFKSSFGETRYVVSTTDWTVVMEE